LKRDSEVRELLLRALADEHRELIRAAKTMTGAERLRLIKRANNPLLPFKIGLRTALTSFVVFPASLRD
jgi:hypothetical protein